MRKERAEKFTDRSLLFDFYAEFLTKHQQHIFEAVVFLDCSLSEVAKETDISRRGVSDPIRHIEGQFYAYEERLHLAGKFHEEQRILTVIQAVRTGDDRETALPTIQKLTDEFLQLTAYQGGSLWHLKA